MKIASTGFAAFAAILWLASAFVRVPRRFIIGTAVVDGYGTAFSKDLEKLATALKWQGWLNVAAATCTAVSIGLQQMAS